MGYLDQFHHQIKGRGDQPKLVLLHGVMGYWANWRRILPAFEEDYQTLVYDQRGHGRSMKPKSGYTPEDYADDLKKILDELGWEKIYLVGHSMGGRNAQNFTSRFPERVIKLVVEDIGPDQDPSAVKRLINLIEKVPTPFDSKRVAKEFLYNDLGNPVIGAYLYSNLIETPEGKWDWRFFKEGIIESIEMGRSRERWIEVAALKVPTLFVRGENSDELSPEVYHRILESNPGVQGVEISGAGHWVHSDQPDAFIAALKKFFS